MTGGRRRQPKVNSIMQFYCKMAYDNLVILFHSCTCGDGKTMRYKKTNTFYCLSSISILHVLVWYFPYL